MPHTNTISTYEITFSLKRYPQKKQYFDSILADIPTVDTNRIDFPANARVPFAPESYRFRIPADAASVIATFEPDDGH